MGDATAVTSTARWESMVNVATTSTCSGRKLGTLVDARAFFRRVAACFIKADAVTATAFAAFPPVSEGATNRLQLEHHRVLHERGHANEPSAQH